MVPVVDAIRKSREVGDREVEIVRFALGGYKQPQMLLTLSYLLSLGGRFDLIINLDGFNDIVLGAHDNIPIGVSIDFPRGWRSMNATQPTHAELVHMATINELTQQRTWLAEFTSHPLLYHSSMGSLSWILIDRILQRRQADAQLALAGETGGEGAIGSLHSYNSSEKMYEDAANVWVRSSIQMNRLAMANGIEYLHVLQPNQYVRDSKPMGDAELQVAYLEDHPYRKHVLAGYPRLLEASKQLGVEGVPFLDLTMLFQKEEEPVYIDTCCHVNQRGNDIIGVAVAKAILRRGWQ